MQSHSGLRGSGCGAWRVFWGRGCGNSLGKTCDGSRLGWLQTFHVELSRLLTTPRCVPRLHPLTSPLPFPRLCPLLHPPTSPGLLDLHSCVHSQSQGGDTLGPVTVWGSGLLSRTYSYWVGGGECG